MLQGVGTSLVFRFGVLGSVLLLLIFFCSGRAVRLMGRLDDIVIFHIGRRVEDVCHYSISVRDYDSLLLRNVIMTPSHMIRKDPTVSKDG